jgi:formylglycine-generating enzyme required for sulfatase activity
LPARFTNSLDMPFALISRGKFRIGGSGGVRGKEEVDIPYDFYLGVYEVRQGDWESVLGKDKNLSRFSRTGNNRQQVADVPDELLKRFPVDGVSWDDCQEFIKVLNERTKEKGWKYRLPRSEEWEYACRGGPLQTAEDDGFDFYLDRPTNTLAADRANFKDTRLNRPRPVGSYAANRLGLYDMHGNVFELCEERKVDEGNMVRKLRGGCWADHDELCRANHVGLVNHSDRFTGSGLRLARVPIDADR